MPRYVVERYLPGEPSEELARAEGHGRAAALEMSRRGIPVDYLGSTFLSQDAMCFCTFEAPSLDAVRTATEWAELSYERIVEALEVRPVYDHPRGQEADAS